MGRPNRAAMKEVMARYNTACGEDPKLPDEPPQKQAASTPTGVRPSPMAPNSRLIFGREMRDADGALKVDKEGPKRREAEELLRAVLAEGPVLAEVVLRLGRECSISETTLREVAASIGVEKKRHGFGAGSFVVWSLNGPSAHESTESMASL